MNSIIPTYRGRLPLLLLALLCPLLLVACSDDAVSSAPVETDAQTLHVAVICSADEIGECQRLAEWAASNIREAQQGMNHPVHLQFTFKSQDDTDLEAYANALAKDSTVDALVSATTTAATRIAATAFLRGTSTKPFISPTATGIEYQRIFANKRNVWNVSECDIAQIEAFMAHIRSTDNSLKVALVVKDGAANSDEPEFAQWFSFLATEYGLAVDGIYTYQDENGIDDIAQALLSSDWKNGDVAVLFVPSSDDVAKRLDLVAAKLLATIPADLQTFYPDIYCTDAFVTDSVRLNVTSPVFQGFELSADPYSGFSIDFKIHFKEEVESGDAQLYDAFTLLALAAKRQAQKGTGTLNDAIEDITTGKDDKDDGDWTVSGLNTYFTAIGAGRTPAINGASGTLTFDVANRTGRSGTFYRLWRLYNHEFLTLGYFSDEKNYRTTTTSGATWNQTASILDSLNTGETHYPIYPDRADNWAFLIAASPHWDNYRFEADVFAMYQILKGYGYDDDHIVLICEDDIAYNLRNPEPGVLRTSANGDNVYDHDAIDYKLSNVSPTDLADILAGRKSERLPHVISSTSNDNVFVFWSGHGHEASRVKQTEAYCEYGAKGSIPHSQLRDMLAAVPHRKMMVAIESCYGGSLGQKCVGIPGLIVVSAANETESSVADVYDQNISAFRSNGFTKGFQTALTANPDITLRDLYYTVVRSTVASHVKVYNAAYYGNIYTETMSEYLDLK